MGIWLWIVLPVCPTTCKSAPIYSLEKLHTHGISDSFPFLASKCQHVHFKKGIPFPLLFGIQYPQEANEKGFTVFSHAISVYATARTGHQ